MFRWLVTDHAAMMYNDGREKRLAGEEVRTAPSSAMVPRGSLRYIAHITGASEATFPEVSMNGFANCCASSTAGSGRAESNRECRRVPACGANHHIQCRSLSKNAIPVRSQVVIVAVNSSGEPRSMG